jgi:hypothetical protein
MTSPQSILNNKVWFGHQTGMNRPKKFLLIDITTLIQWDPRSDWDIDALQYFSRSKVLGLPGVKILRRIPGEA